MDSDGRAVQHEPDSAGASRAHRARRAARSAQYTASGVIGSSVMRTPTASSIALAIAGDTAKVPVSPTPLAPKGPLCWVASTTSRLDPIRHVPDARDLVFGEGWITQLPLGEIHAFEQREAELHDGCAGQLRLDDAWVDRCASIGDIDQAQDADPSGLGIDLDFSAGAADHPVRRRILA